MTAPLTPVDCDLQDFPFMPLHVARLRDSDLAAEASPEACWYAVLLWAASWHQIPAASLPDNDATLTRLIGLGRDVRTFAKHKAQAMRGFVLCDDGRLYHPVVAEQAKIAWEGKLQQRWRTECARIKKHNQRHETNLPQPTYEAWLAAGGIDHSPAPVPRAVPGDEPECPPGQPVQETGTGTERLIEPPNPPLGGPDFVETMFGEAWAAFPDSGLATTSRERSQREWVAALPAAGGAAPLLAAVRAYAAHVKREGTRAKSVPAFHRWLAQRRFDAFLAKPAAATDSPWCGPPAIWAAVVEAKGDAFATSWLSDTGWQDGPVRAVLTASPTAFKRLRDEVGPVLSGLGVQILERAA